MKAVVSACPEVKPQGVFAGQENSFRLTSARVRSFATVPTSG